MRLALGTVQFGMPYGVANRDGQISRKAAKEMLRLALANGIDMLDTAMVYGDSETCLGDAGTKCFKLVTKLPAIPDDCVDLGSWVREQVAASLFRLGANSAYGLLLHRPQQLLGPDGKALYRALLGLIDDGKVQKVGVSVYSPDQLAALIPRYRFDLVQCPFNLVDRRLHSSGWLRRLKNAGIEVHVRSVFLQGLLLMPHAAIPVRFAPWCKLWGEWHGWLSDQDTSAVRACLAFPLAYPEIDRVVVGADSIIQLAQIIDEARSTPPQCFPDLSCEAEDLINPSRWSYL